MNNKSASKSKRPAAPAIDRINIRISGAGGQGIISTGMLLGEAIAIGDGKNVSQSQSYGPEARGGATRADIIVSDGEIFFPECTRLDILVAFTYEAYEKYAREAKSDGLVIAEQSTVDVLVGAGKTLEVPLIQTAEEKFGSPIVANMLALGFLSTYTKIVSQHSLRAVVTETYAGTKHADQNLRALEEGFKLGTRYLKRAEG